MMHLRATTEHEVIVHVDWSKLVQEKTTFACRKELRLCSRVEKLVGPSVMEAWDKVLGRLCDLAEDIAHEAKVEDEETNVAHELCREFRECGFAATWRANGVLKISWFRDGVPTRSDEIIGTISSSVIKHRKLSRARLSTSHSGVSCTFECKAGSVYAPQHLKWDNAGEVLAQYMSVQKWNSVLANLVALADGICQKKTLVKSTLAVLTQRRLRHLLPEARIHVQRYSSQHYCVVVIFRKRILPLAQASASARSRGRATVARAEAPCAQVVTGIRSATLPQALVVATVI